MDASLLLCDGMSSTCAARLRASCSIWLEENIARGRCRRGDRAGNGGIVFKVGAVELDEEVSYMEVVLSRGGVRLSMRKGACMRVD